MWKVKNWIKAKVALLIIAMLWLSLIFDDFFTLIAAYRYDRNTHAQRGKGRFYSVLLAQDLYVNARLGGYFKTTISSELGNQSKHSMSGKIAAGIVDWLFELAGDPPNHCINAIEQEDKHWFSARAALAGFCLWLIGGLFKFVLMVIAISYIYGVITQ